ncbi:permease for cytosine/purines, uracil, thiamine, allantoin-domain-containing protein [Xylariaceae sp. FL0804]|nr:permease for cytosine/purines, uracil, thiamine, allantoin-domain-containing protein [Xylariaceae sp. FL0804]
MSNLGTRMGEKAAAFKHAFTSRQAAVQYFEAPLLDDEDNSAERRRWTNRDLASSPPQDRKWTQWTFLAFWTAHAAGAGSWVAGSSLISVGLEPLSAYLAIATAHLLITVLIVLNGRGPARYHIGFPVFSRATFGMWGSYMVIAMRAVVCIIWNGTNSYYGGRCLSVALTAIWPQYGTMANTLPASAGITTQDLVSFFIFMLVFVLISLIHSRDLHWFYVCKSVYVFVCMHAVLIWYLAKSRGVSMTTLAGQPPSSQSAHAWLVLRAFNSGLGAASSLTVNQGDMTRYARKPSDAIWTTLFGYPLASALPCLYGILVAACAKKLTGTAYWNMWDVLKYMLEQYPDNHGARFGIFLIAVAMSLSYLAVNLATNSLPFGSDLSALFPRWMTIRRGQLLCTILGIAIVPWKLLNSAEAFLTFLSGYGYWLAPIAACMLIDYYVIKKGNLQLPSLFEGSSASRYWYTRGLNYRGVVTVIVALIPCLPSFAAQIAPNSMGMTTLGVNFFYISFLFTYIFACILYYVSYLVFPEKSEIATEKSLQWEQLADENDAEERAATTVGLAEEDVERSNNGGVESKSAAKVDYAKA